MKAIQISFTDAQVEALAHQKDDNPFPEVRKRCYMVYLKALQFKHKDIEKIVGVSHTTVTNTLAMYKEGGLEAIKTRNYKGQPGELHQFKEKIKASLEAKPVATLKEAKARIQEITGIERSLPQVKYILNALGIKRRKVKQIPAKADIEKQEEFKKETLEPLIEQAKQNKIRLFAVDAAHFVLLPFLGFLYSLTTLFVLASPGRKRYNVLGALDMISKEFSFISNETYITTTSICALMDLLVKKYVGVPIYLLLDNARYQKNAAVQEYADKLGIHLVYLPPYSPNLNLIERVWKFLKKKALYSTYYANFDLFKKGIDEALNKVNDEYKAELKTTLTLKFQSFKDAKIKP